MSARELIVLGTASQVPTRHRNHNGYFLWWDDQGMMFDPGEGTQRQMTRFDVKASSIHRILITHFHGDHCLGLPGLIQRINLDQVPHPVNVHYPQSGQVYFERLHHASVFKEVITVSPNPISSNGVLYNGPEFRISAMKLEHYPDSYGYRVEEHPQTNIIPERLAQFGLRGPMIGQLKREGKIHHNGRLITLEEVSKTRPGQVFAFIMDSKYCSAAVQLAKNADIVVCESTYLSSEQKEARERNHMTAADAARVAKKANAKLLVLSHFSQRYPKNQDFLDEAIKIHPNVIAAHDGLRVPMPPRRAKQ